MSDKTIAELMEEFSDELQKSRERIAMPDEIQYPITVKGVEFRGKGLVFGERIPVGHMVMIRPCGEDTNNKTFIGVYLGDLQCESSYAYDKIDEKIIIAPRNNPAIFVPDLNRVVWGMESWWGPIESEDQLKQITDEDIQNVWYVRVLKQLSEKQ